MRRDQGRGTAATWKGLRQGQRFDKPRMVFDSNIGGASSVGTANYRCVTMSSYMHNPPPVRSSLLDLYTGWKDEDRLRQEERKRRWVENAE